MVSRHSIDMSILNYNAGAKNFLNALLKSMGIAESEELEHFVNNKNM